MTLVGSPSQAAVEAPVERSTSKLPRNGQPGAFRLQRSLLLGAIGLTLIAHVHFALHQNVNWDEFWFLSFVYQHARGALAAPLQTFHVHLFGWLRRIDGYEVQQIIVGRFVLLAALLGTLACVYRLARRVASTDAALFAVLCCASYSNILHHGTSFRTDGLSVFLLMVACVLVQTERWRIGAATLAGASCALAMLITVKSAMFFPTLAVLLIANRYDRPGLKMSVLLAFGIGLTVTALGLYVWHRSTLLSSTVHETTGYLESAAAKVITTSAPNTDRRYFLESVSSNRVQWAFLVLAVVVLGRRFRQRERWRETFALLALTLPAFSPLIYRNSFPYFYVFIMPPALVLCALAFDDLRRNIERRLDWLSLNVLGVLALVGFVVREVGSRRLDDTAEQRKVVQAVHEIFPNPVTYIDRNGMIASFPKVGFFMSTWGIESYRSRGMPVFAELLRSSRPQFLLANGHALAAAAEGTLVEPEHALLPEDVRVLRQNFVPYWGPIYVSGMRAHAQAGIPLVWDAISGGTYELLSTAPLQIGESTYRPGSMIALSPGRATLTSPVTQDVVLRTTEAHGVPKYRSSGAWLYRDF